MFRRSPYFYAVVAKILGRTSEIKRQLELVRDRFWGAFERQIADNAGTRRVNAEFVKLRSDLAFAQADYRRAIARDRAAAVEAARGHRTRSGGSPESEKLDRRRPRRRPPGGEPAPAEPRPNPTPLAGGAEAPIE